MTDYYNISFKVCDVTTADLSKLENIIEMTEEVVRSIFSECDPVAVSTYEGIYSDMDKVDE